MPAQENAERRTSDLEFEITSGVLAVPACRDDDLTSAFDVGR